MRPWRLITASKLASSQSIFPWSKTAALTPSRPPARRVAIATIPSAQSDSMTLPPGRTRSSAASPAPPGPVARSSTEDPATTRAASSMAPVAAASCSSTKSAFSCQPGAALFHISAIDTAAPLVPVHRSYGCREAAVKPAPAVTGRDRRRALPKHAKVRLSGRSSCWGGWGFCYWGCWTSWRTHRGRHPADRPFRLAGLPERQVMSREHPNAVEVEDDGD